MPAPDRADRQFLLAAQLSAAGACDGLTVVQMADRMAVDAKTIRRDLTALLRRGFPVEKSRPHATVPYHYRIVAATSLPEPRLTWDEAVALWLAVQRAGRAAETPLGAALRTAFEKIRTRLGVVEQSQLARFESQVQASAPRSAPLAPEQAFDELMFAVEECRIVHLTYTSLRSTEPVTRDVQPYALHQADIGSWYLLACDPRHEAVRRYKLDRIAAVEVTDLRFEKPADFDVRRQFADSFGVHAPAGPPEDIVIRFAGYAARYVQEVRLHPSQQLRPAPDGGVMMSLRLAPTPELLAWVRSFGSAAELLAPPRLREQLAQQLREALANYDSSPSPSPKRTSRTVRRRKP